MRLEPPGWRSQWNDRHPDISIRLADRIDCGTLRLQHAPAQAANSTMRPDDKRQRECIPLLIRIGRVVLAWQQRRPVATVVTRDVRAVWAYGDPRFRSGIVSNGRAIAMRCMHGQLPCCTSVLAERRCLRCVRRLCIVASNGNAYGRSPKRQGEDAGTRGRLRHRCGESREIRPGFEIEPMYQRLFRNLCSEPKIVLGFFG